MNPAAQRPEDASSAGSARAECRGPTWNERRSATGKWAALAGCAIALIASAGCTLLYLFNSDPEGLPCDFSSNPKGACLEGFVCVTVDDGNPDTNDTHQACLKAGQKKKGEICARTEECDNDLVCATGYADCVKNPDDINCELIPDSAKSLACRTKCDAANPVTCGDDEFCFDGGTAHFCQDGVCATDSDCNASAGRQVVGFCVDETIRGGKTGFCFEACDPLACSGGQCPDCRGVDGVVNPDTNCVEVLDASALGLDTMCDTIGPVPPFSLCNIAGDRCQFGSFCNQFLGQGNTACTPWCAVDGTNPSCDNRDDGTPRSCNPIAVGSNLGFCAP